MSSIFVAVDCDGSVFLHRAQPTCGTDGIWINRTDDFQYLGRASSSEYIGKCWEYDSHPSDLIAPDNVTPPDAKADTGKVALSYLPWNGLIEVGKVVDYGATKYARDNWRQPYSKEYSHRYMSAALRHIAAAAASEDHGSALDSESGLMHLAHAACSLLFILDRAVIDLPSMPVHSNKPS